MSPAVLSSVDLHVRFPAGAVVQTACLEDSACGVYPCYYRRAGDRLNVSSSALALIADTGRLDTNPAFQPREYLLGDDARQRFVHGTAGLPKAWKDTGKRVLPAALLRRLSKDRFWYESWDTLDTRVRKLRPFERVTPNGAKNGFRPDFTLRDPDKLVAQVAVHLIRFVRDIEVALPDHHHVMMIGGMDSQILALIPKARPDRWHVFSAAPNFALVIQWFGWNELPIGSIFGRDLFGHDNRNDESPEDTERKIVGSDLYSDPRHMRWLPALRRIAEDFDGRCIFWSGSAGDALHVGRIFHRRYARRTPASFFNIHLTRVPCLVGNYHQVVKNFTGCPLLCPYQTAAIWRNVYSHHGPTVIPAGMDLRPRIGERLAGRPIRWMDRNPGPTPYRYTKRFSAREIYLRHLRAALKGAAP